MGITYEGSGATGNQSTPGSNLTLALPSPSGGILARDLLLACVINNTNSNWASTALSAAGFTRRAIEESGTGTQSPTGAIFYKVASGGESGTITATSPGGKSQGKVLLFRGVDTSTPFDNTDASDFFGSTAAYNIPAQTATVDGVAQVILAWANSASGSFIPPTNPASFSEVADNTISSHPHLWIGYLLGQPSGSTGVRNLVRSGAIRGGGIGVLLRPAADGTATPSAIAATVAMPSPTKSAGSTASPSQIAAAIALPSPTQSAGATAPPGAVTVAVTVPSATGSGTTGGTATPSAITTTATLPAPSLSAGSTVTPSAIATTVTLPAATLSAGSTVSPAALAITIDLPDVAASGSGTGTATPGVITCTTTLPSASTSGGGKASPAAQALTVTMPAAAVAGAGTAAPSAIPLTVTLPATSETGDGTATPAAVAVVTTTPTPGTAAGTTVNPATIALAVTIATAVASAPGEDPNPVTVTVTDMYHRVTVMRPRLGATATTGYTRATVREN